MKVGPDFQGLTEPLSWAEASRRYGTPVQHRLTLRYCPGTLAGDHDAWPPEYGVVCVALGEVRVVQRVCGSLRRWSPMLRTVVLDAC